MIGYLNFLIEKNNPDFLVYAKVYAVLNQINIDPLYLFNEKGRSVTRSLY